MAVLPAATALDVAVRWTPGLGVYDVWVKEGTGVLGWLTVFLPEWVYAAAGVIVGALGLAALWFVASW